MYLKSLTLKGFKSFPDRTRLEFGPGVSVIVGPNGSGKSNVTDAVLWAMGEQSPLAVRGQSMQDVIFGGGAGVQARSSAEVEIVLDNADGTVDLPMGEISIVRRLDRDGEGEYRLNGARCRLVDVLEVLSDTGLGKEMHSVVSQGRVEAIVTSKPKDRRLLIEEAAGLGKHRKRRRRAQLKLERTQDNLDRALDVEREARSRLRPLKRQAEAAELHERLERQTLEARWELARDACAARARRAARGRAGRRDARARARDEAQARSREVAARRDQAEEALAERTAQREALAQRAYAAPLGGRARGAAARARTRDRRRRSPSGSRDASASSRRCGARPRRTPPTTRAASGSRRSRPSWRSSTPSARRARARARSARARARRGRGARRRARAARRRVPRGRLSRPSSSREAARAARSATPSTGPRPPVARRRASAPSSPAATSSCARTPGALRGARVAR